MNDFDLESLSHFILKWNIDFPIDRWWRKTHSVSFNSQRHREVTFIDMYNEWYEDNLYKELSKEKDKYIPGKGEFLKQQERQESLPEDFFDNIDFDKI